MLFLIAAKAFLEPGLRAEAEAETRDCQKDGKDNTQDKSLNKNTLLCCWRWI